MDGILRLSLVGSLSLSVLLAGGLAVGGASLAKEAPRQDGVAAQDDQSTDQHEHLEGEEHADETSQPIEKWTAPETFDPLLEEFRALVVEIGDSAGNTMAHDEKIRTLREHVTTFNDERQPSELSAAVEIQLLLWANEYGPARDAAFDRLDGVTVSNPGLRVLWAQHLKERQFKFEKAIEVLDAGDVDLAKHPIAAVIRAEALVPQNRFDEAEAALGSIPAGASVRPELLDRIYFQRQQIEELNAEWQGEAALREAEAAADDLPRVALETTHGTIVVELYENEAPNTVANFIQLVEQGSYNQSSFYNVVPNSFLGAGDPGVRADEGLEGAPPAEKLNYQLPVELPKPATTEDESTDAAGADAPVDSTEPVETEPDDETAVSAGDAAEVEQGEDDVEASDEIIPLPERGRDHFAGVLSMERAGENADASRFIITLRRRADRDGRNIAFGRVIEGLSIAREITGDDHIVSASVLRKRGHEYSATTIPFAVDPLIPADPPSPAGAENEGEGDDAEESNPPDSAASDDTGDGA